MPRYVPSLRPTVLVATLSAAMLLGVAGTASAARPAENARSAAADCAGRGVPASKVSIQLWTFAGYFGFGTDEAAQAKHEEVLRRLSEMATATSSRSR